MRPIVHISFEKLGGETDNPIDQAIPALVWLRNHYKGDYHFRVDSRHKEVCFDFPPTIPDDVFLLFKLTWGGQ